MSKICFIGYISYNKDGYTSHCDDYKSYQTWILNRNTQGGLMYKDMVQKLMEKIWCIVVDYQEMSKEIAEGKASMLEEIMRLSNFY